MVTWTPVGTEASYTFLVAPSAMYRVSPTKVMPRISVRVETVQAWMYPAVESSRAIFFFPASTAKISVPVTR